MGGKVSKRGCRLPGLIAFSQRQDGEPFVCVTGSMRSSTRLDRVAVVSSALGDCCEGW